LGVNRTNFTHKKGRLPSKMATRNAEVRAVGAWVEPEPFYDDYQEAVISAQYEEAKLTRLQQEKETRLQQFQADVRRRVQAREKIKQEEMLLKSYRAVEIERNVLNQSARAAEKTTPRKNRCMLRNDEDLGIRHSSHSGRHTDVQGYSINGISERKKEDDQFEAAVQQVRAVNSQARKRLVGCQVFAEPYCRDDDLPGGVWKEGAQRDHPSSRASTPTIDHTDTADDYEAREQQTKTVHFDTSITCDDVRGERTSRKNGSSMSSEALERLAPVPNIYPGVECEEEKQQAIKQRAMYRRLFMDIEREQVKENLRRKEHRKKIHELKKEKEQDREKIEEISYKQTAPKHPVTGECIEDMLERHALEERSILQDNQQTKHRQQKEKETERFVRALRSQLREKVEEQNLCLPPLCCCGPTVWDTNPDTCANNCHFYRNPKAYGRALQSLLSSCHLV